MNEVLENMLNAGLDNAIQEVASNDAVQNAVSTVAEDVVANCGRYSWGDSDISMIKDAIAGLKEETSGIDNRIDALEATRVTTGDVVKIAGVTALIAIPVGIGTAYAIKKWVAPKAKEWFAKKPEKAKVVADVEADVVEE